MEAEKLRWAHAQTALEGAEYFIADSELPYVTAELPGCMGCLIVCSCTVRY